MKRSEVNAIIREGEQFAREMNFHLPPFAAWTPADWEARGPECDEIRDNLLGWDVTDFGQGNFAEIGLLVFTIRNGNAALPQYPKPYAEKLLIIRPGQVTPYHFHYAKMEDIINRGGGDLLIQVYNATADDRLAETPVEVQVDGRRLSRPAGTVVRLAPGESITLPTRLYHQFWAEGGMVLCGEVSAVNDDHVDNHFLGQVGRFPQIEEDEPPLRWLCTEYPAASG
jgi:D-lyxose ketol-isomerase